MSESKLAPCPSCKADAAAYCVGSLGARTGNVWCKQCGYRQPASAWGARGREYSNAVANVSNVTREQVQHAARQFVPPSGWGGGQSPTLRLLSDPADREYISNAANQQLDRAGASIGYPRLFGEKDWEYRERLLGL